MISQGINYVPKLHWRNVFRKHCRSRARDGIPIEENLTAERIGRWKRICCSTCSQRATRAGDEVKENLIRLEALVGARTLAATDGEKFLRASNEKRWKPIYIKATTQNARTRRGNGEKKIVEAETVYLHSNSPQDATPITMCVKIVFDSASYRDCRWAFNCLNKTHFWNALNLL